ncbi:MAG: ATP-binding cassette domain-containing protein, partial [Clostridia bacterium]|nr:ATP-binding cassette domain-containing protein [Clostridia bacterium]
MNKSFISRLWKYLRFYRKQIIFSLILAAISVGANLALPVFFGKAIDLIAGEGKVDFSPMAGIFLAVSGLVLAAAVSDFIAQILYAKVADGVTKRVRDDAFKSVEKVPISYIDGRSTGEILSVEIGDADKMSDGLLMGFSRFFSGILTIAGTLVFMFAINWVIASVVAAITPLSLFASKFITGRSYSTFKKQAVATGKTTALTDETLTNLAAIKASSSEEYFTDKFDELNAELKTTSFKASFFSSLVNPTTRFVNAVIYAAVAFSGAMLSVGGVMAVTAGTLIALLSYANRYTKPFNEISSVIAELSGAKACAERLFELIDEKSEEDGTLPLPSRVSGEVVAEKVYFSYDEARPLIRDFSLSVKEGQKVAIVGPTGCGKTTL